MNKTFYSISEVCQRTGLTESKVVSFLEQEWISPVPCQNCEQHLDDEDVARIFLILELQQNLGVNDPSVPVILHLLDQLHYLRNSLKSRVTSK